jgi:hypothetical protein
MYCICMVNIVHKQVYRPTLHITCLCCNEVLLIYTKVNNILNLLLFIIFVWHIKTKLCVKTGYILIKSHSKVKPK